MPEWAGSVLRALLDSSMRIPLIAAGIAAILWGLRIQSSAVRHATWAAVLGTMLLLPFFQYFLPAVAISADTRRRRSPR